MRDRAVLALLAVSVLAGGLRETRAAALGAAAAAGLAAWRAPLPLGPAAWWLPWLAWAGLSCALSAGPWAGVPVLARWAAFAAFLALASRLEERGRREWLWTMAALGAVLAAAALWTGLPHGFGHEMKGLLPPYYNYTVFAAAAAAAVCAGAAAAPGPRARRLGLAALAAGLAAAVLLARSRGGLAGLAAAGAWLAWRRGGWKALLALAATGALAVAAWPGARGALLKRHRARGEARPGIWAAAAAVAVERPLLGEGPGGFAAGFRRRPVEVPNAPARFGLWTPYAHSEPLQAAAETGLLGLLLWLLAMGGTLAGALRRAPESAVRDAARAGLLAATVQLLLDNVLQLTGLSFLYASLAAVAAPRTPDGVPALPRVSALTLAALALAACLPAVLAGRALPGAPLNRRLELAFWAVKVYPSDADRREDLAWMYEGVVAMPEAEAQWAAAEALSPRNAVYSWRRCVLAQALGRPADAEAACARALDSEPGFLSARADRVVALAALGRRAEARAELAELKRRAAAPISGAAESGYERTILHLEPSDLKRAEKAVRSK